MTSHIRKLLDKLCTPKDHKVVIGGLDYSGKTTLLYLLKCDEVIQTTSSIGFNVENVRVPVATTSHRTLNLEAWDVGMGCAGPHIIARMLRWYVPNSKALIWMVDSGDKVRMAESAEVLQVVLLDADHELAQSGGKVKHVPVLVLANKSELPNAVALDGVRKAFATATSGRISSIYSVSLVKKPPVGLPDAFDWLSMAIDIAATTKVNKAAPVPAVIPAGSTIQNPLQRQENALAERLQTWLERAESDSSPEALIAGFDACNLPFWDHYTHIRIAYLLLMAHGRQKGKDMIFEGLSNYIVNNGTLRTNTRAFHFTMTYFWIQIVHFGIRNMPAELLDVIPAPNPQGFCHQPGATDAPLDSPPPEQPQYPSPSAFFRFLLVNPHMADGSLWTKYYSKEIIMSPEAKVSMVLPDKKPLPNLVVRDAITTLGLKTPAAMGS